ncbi:spore germination protein [Sporosarcina luteola]|uniref:spore germination protein n=1 Tax=Sporosarcina luteola TaxID=582850 RepID=UPI00203F9AFD|nr:spore germination protein [Sporosarcina luteola]MCM3709056.1 spore germination protein [Sporosarcina luteola]
MQSSDHEMDITSLRALFQKSADVQFQSYTFNGHAVTFVTCDAMIDQQLLNEVIVPRVRHFIGTLENEPLETAIESQLHIPDLKAGNDLETVIHLVYSGHVLLFFEDSGFIYTSNITKKPNRNPEETRLEVPVKGPRDNFIEDVSVNIALIRKRLPTNSLCVEKFELGKRSKTTVALLYFDDIASKKILDGIRRQLNETDTDIVFNPTLLMESANKSSKLFPRVDYTGRPDTAIQSLVRGRFLIFVDGAAYCVILPVNLFLLVKTGEDNDTPVIYGSIERLLRVFGLSIGLTLPAFWLALTTYHQDQLPVHLLATVVQANTGLPFPSVIEMLLMLLMFELFREAGLRLPTALGGTIGVVGGLIIGDAAIRAGITSPAMIVVIAISTIATFTLVNQSVVTAISVLRVCFILLTAILGLFGLLMSVFITLVYLSSIRTFGVPYMNIATDLSFKTVMQSLFRLPHKSYKERPNMLNPTDPTRTKERDQDE